MQTKKLRRVQKQEKQPRQIGNEQILSFLQKTHSPQRNEIINGLIYPFVFWVKIH